MFKERLISINIRRSIYNIYSQLLIMFFVIFFIALGSLFLKIDINRVIFPISYITSIIFSYFINKEKNLKEFLIVEIAVFILIVFSLSLSGKFYDTSWDGMEYHQNAIIGLSNGWNPIYEKIEGQGSLWNNYYPKYIEIVQSCIFSTFNKIEMAKMININFIIMAIIYSFYILLEFNCSYKMSILYSLLIGLNPVAIYQVFSFYNDGILACIIVMIVCIILDLEKDDKKIKYINLIMLGCIAVNIKFTLLGYVFFSGGMYFVYRLFKKKNIKNLLISAIMILVIGVAFLGFNPYIVNLKEGHNVFYPLMGSEKVDIMTHNQPTSFADKNRMEKFLISVFSRSENINNASKKEPTLKIPLSLKSEEIDVFKTTDARIAGWGPLFSGILLLSLIIFIGKKYIKSPISILLLGICTTVFINPEAWWARYVPQLYIIPIIVLITFNIDSKLQNGNIFNKFYKVISVILVLLCILNITLVTSSYIKTAIRSTNSISSELEDLKKQPIEVYVKSNLFKVACLNRLDNNNIEYTVVNEMSKDKNWIALSTSRNTIYVTKKI